MHVFRITEYTPSENSRVLFSVYNILLSSKCRKEFNSEELPWVN